MTRKQAHHALNTFRGVISEDDLTKSLEEEILKGMRSQGVAVKRTAIGRDDKKFIRDTWSLP
ncbi:MAG: hypothetical protein O7D30_03650 [Rickettsia endosymbiont of Ixodes persulcatus]|nr:hypothetical protein [Rickettsia endosymbiont of Ixodes persulcatus]